MNGSTEHPLHETLLHDALHAHVRESGGDAAGARLAGLADGALRVARRRQRLARTGVGVAAVAVVATAWVAFAGGTAPGAQEVRPGMGGGAGKAVPVSLLPVTSATERACAQGSGGYTVKASANHPASCVHADRAGGMSDIRVASATAEKSTIDGTWQVEVTLSPTDRTRFAALTGSIAGAPAPRNSFAIVIDGKLWDMPSVTASLTGGRFEIIGTYVGDLTSATAHNLADRLDPGR
ncbi:hypothetical protein [Streptomyces sp. SID13726]|uniref:SecDF P1 head subdomain-containing protein n=1 Tax=Streptomyces sp. SID13726 TaxID=2706058 RepID=UPI0013BD33DF|nr:hypothetical protein [Streptomyces sp. SID13726]NEB03847.1 hypothetical protein [Streptomyces sp. SID13726]